MKQGAFRILWLMILIWVIPGCDGDREKILPLYSPDKALRADVMVNPAEGVRFRVFWNGEKILRESFLKLDLDGFPDFLRGMTVESLRMAEIQEKMIPMGSPGMEDRVHCFQNTWILKDQRNPDHRIYLEIRAYNHAIAFRYRIPVQPGLESFRVMDEVMRLQFMLDPQIWARKISGNDPAGSRRIRGIKLDQLETARVEIPVLIRLDSEKWAVITEEETRQGGSLTVGRDSGLAHTLFTDMDDGQDAPAGGRRGRTSPWRIFILDSAPENILDADLIRSLRSGHDGDLKQD